jgi:hypothetical protein
VTDDQVDVARLTLVERVMTRSVETVSRDAASGRRSDGDDGPRCPL